MAYQLHFIRERWSEFFKNLFNFGLLTETIPESWKGSILHQIYKDGSHSSSDSYLLIALLDTDCKYFARLLLIDLEKWATKEKCIPFNQTGFKAKSSTADNLTSLDILMEKAITRRQLLYTCFIDFTNACDHLNRDLQWKKTSFVEDPS